MYVFARLLIFGACSIALLTACASYRPAPISPAKNAQRIESRSLRDPRMREFVAAALAAGQERAPARADAAWGLRRLTLAALYYHPDLDIARARLAEAQAGVVTAEALANPRLSFEELSYNASVAGPSPWTVAPVVNFLIETFGKREYRSKETRALVAAAHAGLLTAAWQVRAGVRDALIDLWAARRRLDLVRQRLTLQDQLAVLLEHRFAAGAASAFDLARERTRRDRLTLALRDAERRRAEARTRLAAAIGVAPAALDDVTLSFAAVEEPAGSGLDPASPALRREALVHRSDVQDRLAEYASAEAALALEIANQYPNLTLGPGYDYDMGQNKYVLLPAADLPVFNQNQGPIAQAAARREAAAGRFTALQMQVVGAIDGAAAGYRAAMKTLAAADALLAAQRDREARMLQSFAAGEIDRPTLLTAQIERSTVDQARFNALLEQRRALALLEDALQQPFFATAAPVSPETAPRGARQ